MPKNVTVQSRRAKTANKTSNKPRVSAAAPQPAAQEIAEGAYYRFLERAGAPGDEFNDWLEAERKLRAAQGVE